jgi:ABC-type Fe3+ transport system permease subunit
LGTSILLYSTNNEVLSVALIELAEYGGSGLVAALAMIQSMMLFGGFLLANRLAGVKTIGPVM